MKNRSKTSHTVSVKMLKWSLARSIQMGMFSRRLFQKELIKVSARKSTIDIKPKKRLIVPNSVDDVLLRASE